MSPDPDPDSGTVQIQDIDDSLDGLERLVWRLLDAGARSGREALHLGTLCTIGPDGYPTARTMALREVDAALRLVCTHADLRSPKVDGLGADPRSTWVFHDPRRQLQVVLKGDTHPPAGDAARGHFGVLVTHVVEMEILHLHHAGHRRARFRYDRRDVTAKDWLAP